MRYKSSITVIAVLAFFVIKSLTNKPPYDEKESLILHGVLQFIEQLHFDPKPIDDDFSTFVFDTYLERIDPSKRYFIQDDIEQLEKFKYELDDQTKVRVFDFFDLSLVLLDARMKEARTYYDELIDAEFDFTVRETIEFDDDKKPWAKDKAALKDEWRKFLKYEVLSRVDRELEKQEKNDTLEQKTVEVLIEEAREDIKDRFGDWFERLESLRRSDHFETYMGAITNYFDPHTGYFNPKEKQDFDINMGGKLEGIGARLQQDGEYIKVVEIIVGGPAWKGKELESGDLLLAVTQEGEEPVDIVGMRTDDAIQMIRGKKGTVVILTTKKQDGTVTDIRIERDEVIIDESFARSAIIDIPDVIENIGYIKLPKFYSSFEKEDGNSCAADVAKEIEKLKKNQVNGIILDLRNNTGGSLNDVVEMSGLFIEKGPIVQVKSRDSKPYVHTDDDESVQYDGPLIIMVNHNSASASEILVAAMQDYGRAIIVGGNSTFGKGSVQRFYDLDRAIRGHDEMKPLGNVKLTVQKFYRVNGGSTQLKGVIPDIILPDNFSYIESGEKQYSNAMPWTEIKPKEFKQHVVEISKMSEIAERSKSRVSANPNFQLSDAKAKMIKVNQDISAYSLNLKEYREFEMQREKEAEKFAELFKKDIDHLAIKNLPEDADYIRSDESRTARNEDWVKGLKKDFYLEETLFIMKDMIESEPSFTSLINKIK